MEVSVEIGKKDISKLNLANSPQLMEASWIFFIRFIHRCYAVTVAQKRRFRRIPTDFNSSNGSSTIQRNADVSFVESGARGHPIKRHFRRVVLFFNRRRMVNPSMRCRQSSPFLLSYQLLGFIESADSCFVANDHHFDHFEQRFVEKIFAALRLKNRILFNLLIKK